MTSQDCPAAAIRPRESNETMAGAEADRSNSPIGDPSGTKQGRKSQIQQNPANLRGTKMTHRGSETLHTLQSLNQNPDPENVEIQESQDNYLHQESEKHAAAMPFSLDKRNQPF